MQIIQEIAAARHVLVMCGSTEIDGYAFCLGLELFKGFYEDYPELQGPIHSVTYLIRGAIFRPKYATSTSGRVSLDICPLGELMDMYHTHKATKRHDKVYALLGMSSDDLSKASLSPNYEVPWKQLLQRLVKFLLCEQVSVETWDDREMAVIKSKGGVIGQVSSVERNGDDRQNVHIVFKNTPEHLGHNKEWNTPWTLQATAKSVQEGDLVCHLQGASKPTIIRPYKDYFAIIMIAATPPEAIRTDSGCIRSPEPPQSIRDFPHDFLLLWNWEKSQERSRNRENYKTLLKAEGRVQDHSKTGLEDHLGTATRLWNAALILEDSEEHEEAKERLREATEGYEKALGEGHSHTLTVMETLALVYIKTKQWEEGEQLFLRVIQIKKGMQGAHDPDTLSSMASLALAYRDEGHLMEAKKLEMMIHLLKLRGAQITEEMVLRVARSFDEEVMLLLLDRKGNEIQITEEVVKAAEENWPSGREVMTLLLDRKGDEIQITEGAVVEVARRFDREVMTFLLDRKGDEIQITEEVVKAAAENWLSGREVMTLLLDRKRDKIQITEGAVVEVARRFDREVMTLLLDRKRDEIQITEEVVKAAAGNNRGGREVMTLLLDRKRDEIQITEGAVVEVARRFDREVMTLLLDRKGDEIQITEEVVKAAAENWLSGREVMTLLLDRKGDEIQITEEVVKSAAGNWPSGREVMTLLLDRRGNDIQTTE
jgi:hypothetical protein